MDLLKGIGNFFGGLIGGKKKKEEDKVKVVQPQRPAVTFSTPKPPQVTNTFKNPNTGVKSPLDTALNLNKDIQKITSQPSVKSPDLKLPQQATLKPNVNEINRNASVDRATKELSQPINDKSNYYGSDAAKLKQEINKGDRANYNVVNGLTQSLQNRRKELTSGKYKSSNPYRTQEAIMQRKPQLDKQFKRGDSFDDIAVKSGLSTDQVRQFKDQYYKNYGDKGVVGNSLNFAKDMGVNMFKAGAGIVTKPFNELTADNNETVKTVNELTRRVRTGELTPEGALEQAQKIADSRVAKRVGFNDDGNLEMRQANPLEFAGDIARQGVDTGSLLPFAGGVAQGSSKVAQATGNNVLGAGLSNVGKILNPYQATAAGTKTADLLSKLGISDDAASMLGSSLSTNARQSAVMGTAETGVDVLQGRGITPESLAVNYGADFLMGTIPEVALGGVAQGIKGVDNTIHNSLLNSNVNYRNLANQLDVEANPARRVEIEDMMTKMRHSDKQGGYFGPGEANDSQLNSYKAYRGSGDGKQIDISEVGSVQDPIGTGVDRSGNTFAEQEIPVSSLTRRQDFQPRTTASGKGTEDSVYRNGYQEGYVDQPMLVRKVGDKYEVLGGHSRTLGMERRASEGLSNPEVIRARVYEGISDDQAKVISRGANQGGQYEDTLDMAKSISESLNEGKTPSVQKQNMIKGYSYDDYKQLNDIVSSNNRLKDNIAMGAISHEDVLNIARHSRKKGLDPQKTMGIIDGLSKNDKLTKQNANNVIDLLTGKIKAGLMQDNQTGLFGDIESAVNSVDLLADHKKMTSELTRRGNALKQVMKEGGLTKSTLDELGRQADEIRGRLKNVTDEIIANQTSSRAASLSDSQAGYNTMQSEVLPNPTPEQAGLLDKISNQESLAQTMNQNQQLNTPQSPTGQPVRNLTESQTQNTSQTRPESRQDNPPQDSNRPYNTNDTPDPNYNHKEYLKTLEAEQKAARKGQNPSLKERLGNTKDFLKKKFIDRFAPIEDKLTAESDKLAMRDALDRTLRADGIAQAFAKENGLVDTIQSFRKDTDFKEFDQALLAKHAIDLNENGINTGRDIASDKQLLETIGNKYDKQFESIRKYNDKMLNQSVDYGLISEDTAKMLKDKYKNYVPFDRIFTEEEIDFRGMSAAGRGGEASLSKQDIVQRIKGSNRKLDSPLNALLQKTEDMMMQGERNQTAKLLVSHKDTPGNPFQLEPLKPGEVINGRPTVSYLDGGKKVTYLTSPEIAEAAKHMNREQLNVVMQVIAAPARVLRLGATGVNIGFAGANAFKDYWGAAINSKNGKQALNPIVVVKSLQTALNHDGKTYQELMREGVTGNSYEMMRNSSLNNLKDVRSQRSVLSRAKYNANPLRWVDTLENTIGRSEDFGRAVQYLSNKRAFMNQGMSESQAIKAAADQARYNSTNFARAGEWGKALNSAIPYVNAGIQGQRIFLRRFKENPGRYAVKTFVGIGAPAFALSAYAYGTEDNKKVMDDLPDYEKDANLIVPIDPKYNEEENRWEGVVKIPIPPQYLPMFRQIRKAVSGELDVKELVGAMTEQMTTINPTDPVNTLNEYIPQAVKLMAEPMTNTNFYTKDKIVPDSMKNLDPREQSNSGTSITADTIGDAFNLSPLQLDNVYRTATAGAGQNLLNVVDWVLKNSGVVDTDKDPKGRPLLDSVTGRFVGPKGTSDGQDYYASLDEAMKKNKLSGYDLNVFNAVNSQKYKGDTSVVEGKNEQDAILKNRALATSEKAAKTLADAAKIRSKRNGSEVDPLYKLPIEQQMYYYHIQGTPKDSAEQRDLENKAGDWFKKLKDDRREYFDKQDIDNSKSNRVKFPERSSQDQAIVDKYFSMPNGEEKWAFSDNNPQINNYFKDLSDYNNKVREEQGYAPLRVRPQPTKYVQSQMDNKNFKDPAVQAYLQDKNIYDATNLLSLAQMKGNDLDSKTLKAVKSLGYSIVKQGDGTYALKFDDPQGSGQVSGVGVSGGSGGGGSRGSKRSRGSGGSGGKATTGGSLSSILGINQGLAKSMSKAGNSGSGMNKIAAVPQFTAKARTYDGLLRSKNVPKARGAKKVTFK